MIYTILNPYTQKEADFNTFDKIFDYLYTEFYNIPKQERPAIDDDDLDIETMAEILGIILVVER